MITHILARDFKGLTFETPIGKRTLFLGENGVGKSARSQALILSIIGYLPGAQKTNAEILENFGKDPNPIVTGFKTENGYLFERAFGKTKSGSVSQAFKVNGKKCTEEFYMQTMGESGNPRILDLSVFLKLSDQKKIDLVFGLYPPSEDISGLDGMIETQKKNILKHEDDARKKEDAAASLIAERASIKLPSGSLAELKNDIEKAEAELKESQENLKKVEIEEAELKAAEDAKKKAEIEAEKKAKEVEEKNRKEKERLEKEAELAKKKAEFAEAAKQVVEEKKEEKREIVTVKEFEDFCKKTMAIESLDIVLKAMDDAGCVSCAARLVIKREMRRFK
jgi:hypothetical protein